MLNNYFLHWFRVKLMWKYDKITTQNKQHHFSDNWCYQVYVNIDFRTKANFQHWYIQHWFITNVNKLFQPMLNAFFVVMRLPFLLMCPPFHYLLGLFCMHFSFMLHSIIICLRFLVYDFYCISLCFYYFRTIMWNELEQKEL